MNAAAVYEVIKEGMTAVAAIVAELRALLTDGAVAVTPELARERIAKLRAAVRDNDARIDAMLAGLVPGPAPAERAAAEVAEARHRAAKTSPASSWRKVPDTITVADAARDLGHDVKPSTIVHARLQEVAGVVGVDLDSVEIWLDEKSDELDALDDFAGTGGRAPELDDRIDALVAEAKAAFEAERTADEYDQKTQKYDNEPDKTEE